MIAYVTTAEHAYTVRPLLRRWRRDLRRTVRPVSYDKLAARGPGDAATVVLSDLERLSPRGVAWADEAARVLEGAGLRVLNQPWRWLERPRLLPALHHAGLNVFSAGAPQAPAELRFPVFLRSTWDHSGPLSELLDDDAALASELRRLEATGHQAGDLLATEYCGTAAPDGVFWKYSAYFIAGEVIPRRLTGTRAWWEKDVDPTVMLDGGAQLELGFIAANPHAGWVREVFGVAGVDFGRVDYALFEGRPQAWEVNTNPMLLERRSLYLRETRPAQDLFAAALADALKRLDEPRDISPVMLPPLPEGAFRHR